LDSNVGAVDPTTGRRLARMRLQQDVPVLELIAPQVKALAGGDAAFRHALQEATVWHEHAATHTVAERLLNRFSRAAGLRWHSRQSSKEIATLLYLPPAAEDWLVELDSVALDTPSGFAYIDEALAEFGWVRLDADALALETEVPDDADDEV
jgi:hypothetical protein